MDTFYDDVPPLMELEANLDFVASRAKAIGELFRVLYEFKENVERYGISPVKYHGLLDHLCEELLRTETEKTIIESDLAKERFLAE